MTSNRLSLIAGLCVMLFSVLVRAAAESPISNPSFEATAAISNEMVTLSGTSLASFAHSGILPSSVVVRNGSGTVTYTRGVDYVLVSGSKLGRTSASAIPNGSTVRVSYNYCVMQDWATYTYTVPGGNPGVPVVGALGSEGTFDVLFPHSPTAPQGQAVCGAQAWGNSCNGGVRQTFTWGGGPATITVTARAYSQDYSYHDLVDGCLVRMGLVPYETTNRADVVEWVAFPWGNQWRTRSLSVPNWGTYTLFIEAYQPNPYSNAIMSTLWDKVTWAELPPIDVLAGPTAVTPGDPDHPDTTVRIEWTTNVPSASRVEFGPDLDYGSVVEDAALVTQHSVLITGLTNSSLYHYRASSTADGYAEWVSDDREFLTPVQFTDITTGPGPDGFSTVISWKTDVPTTSQVEYGPTEAYGQVSEEDPALSTDHQVVLTDLTEDTDYHFRVRGTNNPLYTPASSADRTMRTLPDPRPSLENGSFENGHGSEAHSLFPWVQYAVAVDTTGFRPIDGLVGPFAKGGTDFWFAGVQAYEGAYFAGAAANYDYKNGGLLQRVQVAPGQPCTLSAHYATYRSGGTVRDTRFRLGIDPNGGVDPQSPNIQWRSVYSPTNNNQWHVDAITANAGPGGLVTAFLDVREQWPLEWHVVAFDNVHFAPPIPMTIGQLKSSSQGVGAVLSDKVVTYVRVDPVQVDGKAYVKAYVQEPDGSAGIAVLFRDDVPALPAVGNKVTVTGSIVLLSMEAMLLAHDWTLDSGIYPLPAPISLCHRSIGGSTPVQPALSGSSGACNVGTRVRIAGRVTWSDNPDPFADATVFVDDGSGVTNGQPPGGGNPVKGILAKLRSNGFVGAGVGDYIAVTGVVGIQRIDPNGWPDTGDEYYTYVVSVADPYDWDLIMPAGQ